MLVVVGGLAGRTLGQDTEQESTRPGAEAPLPRLCPALALNPHPEQGSTMLAEELNQWNADSANTTKCQLCTTF